MKNIIITLLLFLVVIACEKNKTKSDGPKVNVSISPALDISIETSKLYGKNVFVAVFKGSEDNPVFVAAAYTQLEAMQSNSIDMLKVIDNKLSTEVATLTTGNYYIGAYIDVNNSTTDLTDITKWQPDEGDYDGVVSEFTIEKEDVKIFFDEFEKFPEQGILSVRLHNDAIFQGNPVYYNVISKNNDEIISAGRVEFPLSDDTFIAKEIGGSQNKTLEGGGYYLQIYSDLDNSQADYSIGDEFKINFGDVFTQIYFEIDGEMVTGYFNGTPSENDKLYLSIGENVYLVGYTAVDAQICGSGNFNGVTSYLTIYKKESGGDSIYGTSFNYYAIYPNDCYTYYIKSKLQSFIQHGDYLLHVIVDVDSSSYTGASSYTDAEWRNIVANKGDLELVEYPLSLSTSDTTIALSLDEFNTIE